MKIKVLFNCLFYFVPLILTNSKFNQNFQQKHNEFMEVLNILTDTERYNKNLYPNEEKGNFFFILII